MPQVCKVCRFPKHTVLPALTDRCFAVLITTAPYEVLRPVLAVVIIIKRSMCILIDFEFIVVIDSFIISIEVT